MHPFCHNDDGRGDPLCPHCEGRFLCPRFPQAGPF